MAEQLGMARELVDLTLQEARAAIGGLRPPVLDDLGLAGGLASLARSIGQIDVQVDLARNPAARSHRDRAVPHRAGMPAERRQARRRIDGAADVHGRRGRLRRDRAPRNRRRRSRFRHLRASVGQRRDGRLRAAVDGRARRDRRRTAQHPVAARLRNRGHRDDPAAQRGGLEVMPLPVRVAAAWACGGNGSPSVADSDRRISLDTKVFGRASPRRSGGVPAIPRRTARPTGFRPGTPTSVGRCRWCRLMPTR